MPHVELCERVAELMGPGSYYHNDRNGAGSSMSDVLCGQAQIDQSIIAPIAFDQTEADNCFIQSCKMIGVAGAQWPPLLAC